MLGVVAARRSSPLCPRQPDIEQKASGRVGPHSRQTGMIPQNISSHCRDPEHLYHGVSSAWLSEPAPVGQFAGDRRSEVARSPCLPTPQGPVKPALLAIARRGSAAMKPRQRTTNTICQWPRPTAPTILASGCDPDTNASRGPYAWPPRRGSVAAAGAVAALLSPPTGATQCPIPSLKSSPRRTAS